MINACAALRPDATRLSDPIQATKAALRTVAMRAKHLREEVKCLDRQLTELVAAVAPTTFSTFAMGVDTTSALLVTIGDNPDRLRSEAAFARLCGVAPIPDSPGRPTVTASTVVATVPETGLSTSRPSFACATAPRPGPTWPGGRPRGSPNRKSSGA